MAGGEIDRYLRLLGMRRPISGADGLDEIVHRHLCRIPFENVSKLLLLGREGAGRVTTLDEFLEGIEHYNLGGTCYSSNLFLAFLLDRLGYDTELLGADMTEPNVHTSIRVRIRGVAYHVDVGFGAPFRRAIRLDRLPWEFVQGQFRFVFDRTQTPGTYQAGVYSGERRLYGYVVHPPGRTADFFDRVVLDSYRPGKTFTGMLRIIRFFDDYAVDLEDNRLSIHRGGETTTRLLRNLAALRAAVAGDLAMPRCPIEEAVAVLERRAGKNLFDGLERADAV